MNGWIKSFTDGTNEIGSDKNNSASWSRGKLNDICSVRLDHRQYTLEISGLGNYWQSDTYEVVFGGQPVITKRRIEKQIIRSDKYFYYFNSNDNKIHSISFEDQKTSNTIQINSSLIDKWLILELNLKNKSIHYYFSNNRI